MTHLTPDSASDPAARRPRTRHRRARWRWAALLLCVAFAGIAARYVYLTQPERLRARFLSELSKWTDADVELDGIRFSPWEGLCVDQLTVVNVEGAALTPRLDSSQPLPVLEVEDLSVRCALWPLLGGRIEPQAIGAGEVTLTVIQDLHGGNNLALRPEMIRPSAAGKPALPRVDIERLRLRLWATNQGALRLQEEWRLALRARMRAGSWVVEVHHAGDAASREQFARLAYSPGNARFEGDLSWVTLDTLCLIAANHPAGARLAALRDELELTGEARVNNFALEHGRVVKAALKLRELRGAVPVEAAAESAQTQVEVPYLTFGAGAGELVIDESGGEGLLSAQLHGANAELKVNLARPATRTDATQPDEPAPAWGVNLTFTVDTLTLPTQAANPQFVESPRLPGPVRAFFKDYLPAGTVNLRVDAERAVGAAPDNWHVAGRLEALDMTCRYFRFPYDVEDAHGMVYFEDGRIRLEHIRARHGGGWVFADGVLDSPDHWTGFEMTFRGVNIPLDRDLYEALPVEYQRIWMKRGRSGSAMSKSTCGDRTVTRRAGRWTCPSPLQRGSPQPM